MKFIKNKSSLFLPKTAVILAHNDDEFFISPILSRLRRDTIFIFLTAGSVWCEGLNSIREKESLKFLSSYGFSEKNIVNLGEKLVIKDGSLFKNIDIVDEELEKLLIKLGVKTLIVTAYEGGHHDHDVAFILAHNSARKLNIPLFDFPLYNASSTRFFRVMNNRKIQSTSYKAKHCFESTFLQRFFFLCRASIYRSQWKTFVGLLPGLIRNFLLKKHFSIGEIESFSISIRQHEGPLFYEKRFHVKYSDMIDSILFGKKQDKR